MAGCLGAIEYLEQFGTGETAREADRPAPGPAMAAYEQKLTLQLIEGLRSFKGLTVRGITSANAMHRRVPTVSFTLDGHHPAGPGQGLCRRQHLRLVRPQLRHRAGAPAWG